MALTWKAHSDAPTQQQMYQQEMQDKWRTEVPSGVCRYADEFLSCAQATASSLFQLIYGGLHSALRCLAWCIIGCSVVQGLDYQSVGCSVSCACKKAVDDAHGKRSLLHHLTTS